MEQKRRKKTAEKQPIMNRSNWRNRYIENETQKPYITNKRWKN